VINIEHIIYRNIKVFTNQKNVTEELDRLYNSYIKILYAASTPAVNFSVAYDLLYNSDIKVMKQSHRIEQNRYEIIAQHFDRDFFEIFNKHYKVTNKNYDPSPDTFEFLKKQLYLNGPTLVEQKSISEMNKK